MNNGFKIKGKFRVEHIRDGKVIGIHDIKNAVVNEGLDAILDIMFHADTQITTWYLGLIGSAVLADLLATDTMASHPNWTEEQSYTEGVRQEWDEDAASGQEISNSTYVAFSINATTTISGIFCCSDSTKGGSSGTLWATGLFTNGDVSVQSGDTLNVTYTITGAAA